MLTFGQMHDWQGSDAVKQIMVFSSVEMQEIYEREMLDRLDKEMREGRKDLENISDTNAGALFKLRAVRDINKKWIPVIRCGLTAYEIYEGHRRYTTPEAAIVNAAEWLGAKLQDDFIKLVSTFPSLVK